MRKLYKKAGVWSDYFSGMPAAGGVHVASMISPALGAAANFGVNAASTGGLIHGLSNSVSDEDIDRFDRTVAKSFIPGVGTSRSIRRLRHNAEKTGGKHPTANVAGEVFGTSTSLLASTLAGAALGAIAGKLGGGDAQSALAGLGIGAGVGGGLGGLTTLLRWGSAGLTPRRTKAEQKEHDDSTNIDNWLVPGSAVYNHAKRFGRLLEEQDEREAKRKVKKQASALRKKAGLLSLGVGAGIGAATVGGINAYKRHKEERAQKALNSLIRAAIIGGGTYVGSGLLDPDNQHRGGRAIAALLAGTGTGLYDLHSGNVKSSDYDTLWKGVKAKYNS